MGTNKSVNVINPFKFSSFVPWNSSHHRLTKIDQEIKSLGSASYKNYIKLVKLAADLKQALYEINRGTFQIRGDIYEARESAQYFHQRRVLPRAILDHVKSQLAFEYLNRISNSTVNRNPSQLRKDINKKIKEDLKIFQRLIKTLWDHDVDITWTFGVVIADPKAWDLAIWNPWHEIYQLLRKKSDKYRRHFLMIKNSTTSMFSQKLQAQVTKECTQILEKLEEIFHDSLINHYQRNYGRAGKIRSNSVVWAPVLYGLHQTLAPHFDPKRHWETPGGVKNGSVTPNEVFEVIGDILYFSFPYVWPYRDGNTIKSIKTRCLTPHKPSSFKKYFPFHI